MSCEVHHIVPSKGYPCSVDSCLTLSQFAENSTSYVDSNTTLFITRGSHHLNKRISLSNTSVFLMLSINTTDSTPVINCSEHINFTFSNITSIFIGGLEFTGCSGNKIEFANQLTIKYSVFHGVKGGETSLTIVKSKATMTAVSFLSNTMGTYLSNIRPAMPAILNYSEPLSASATVGGALIVTHSNLTIINCQFEENEANIGGAIFSELESHITISNSDFTSNHATGCDNDLCFGGAMFIDGTTTVIVHNSTFQNNTSDQDGGVAVVFNATLIVSQSSYAYNNTATRYGGTVSAFQDSILTFKTTTFNNNKVNLDGGAVYMYESSATFNDCVFLCNVADRMGGVIAANTFSSITLNSSSFTENSANNGGVMSVTSSSTSIENSDFSYNTANENGAVLHIYLDSNVSIDDTLFSSNHANDTGGVVYGDDNASVIVHGGTFILNSASSGGVMSIISNSRVSIFNSNFSNNTADNANGGTLIAHTVCIVTIGNSSFSSNIADNDGAILASDGGVIMLDGSSFKDNVADENGGVAFVYNNCTIVINSCNFTNNRAGNSGGVVYGQTKSTVTISNSIINNSRAEDLGGGVYVQRSSNVYIKASNFASNSADYGGALVVRRNSTVTIDEGMFMNNIADTDGATLYARIKSTLAINNSFFIHNTAINDGVVLAADSSIVMLNNSTFSDNVAGFNGGAVFLYDNSTTDINNCSISNSMVGDSGGAAYGRKNSTISISNSIADNITAENSGGAVYAQQDSNVIIETSNFTNNTADYGGVVRVYIRSTASITDSSFSGNKGDLSGGVTAAYKNSTMKIQTCSFTFNAASFGSVSVAYNSNITFENNTVLSNNAQLGGVMRVLQAEAVVIVGSTFRYNTAGSGGVLYVQGSNLSVETSLLEYNSARYDGGVLYTESSCVTVTTTTFDHNSAKYDGGVINANSNSTISFSTSVFSSNTAEYSGGVMALLSGSITTVESSDFTNNRAQDAGGVISLLQSNATIFNSTFSSSLAGSDGGVVHTRNGSFAAKDSSFTHNTALDNGGVVDAHLSSSLMISCSIFIGNTAITGHGGALYLLKHSNSTIANSIFDLNTVKKSGGAISASTSSRVKISRSHFSHNRGKFGAALAAEQNSYISFDSHLFSHLNESCQEVVDNKTEIYNNSAELRGAAIYLKESSLYFGQKTSISHNQVGMFGGGIHAVNSSITIGSTVQFNSNEAKFGGGISLVNSKLHNEGIVSNVNFVSNHAVYGGALYVDDESETAVCSSDPRTGVYSNASGCFFQDVTESLMINFNNNFANVSGHNLYGGLLDRCTVISDTNPSRLEPGGTIRLIEISNIRNYDTISSQPVRVCLCKDNEPDCSQETYSIQIRRGKINIFTIPLAAVDQISQTVAATFQSRFRDPAVSVSQTVQRNSTKCYNLEYQVSFPNVSKEHYELSVYADSSCDDKSFSSFSIGINVISCSCPLGFMPEDSNTECTCICDQQLFEFIQMCNFTEQSIIREGEFWVTYISDPGDNSSALHSYLVYPYCPFDYCYPPSIPTPINLNQPNGADAQCANNRSGVLCGSCRLNYSLSLGSSKCIKCPNNWYGQLVGIIIASFLAGIILVILLLMFNLTVAVGTLNSIIFYANIIDVNRSIYFGQSHLTFVPVFISWLNLDIGIDVCFFEEMDTYAKTWLQLAFPAYIIFIVIVIISLSSCSSKFSNLIGKKNPVSTLATLILLSYTKLLGTIIASFSLASLRYPNGTTTVRWLPDASIEYHEGKVIVLVCVAIFILFLGLLYTILLLSWQWLLNCPNSKYFKWTGNQRLHSFIDTYHTPHTIKHRYWFGLLLLVRVIVYLVSAFSISVDPRITLLSTVVIMCCLFLYKTVWLIRVYKNSLLNTIESFVYFNIAIFTTFTWYTYDDLSNRNKEVLQTVSTYISVGTILFLFFCVIIFHMYRYGSTKIYDLGQNTKLGKKIKAQMSYDERQDIWSRSRNTYKLFKVMDDPREGSGYTPPPLQTPSSVISMESCHEALTSKTQEVRNTIGKNNTKKLRGKTHTPKGSSSKMKEFALLRKTELPNFRSKSEITYQESST